MLLDRVQEAEEQLILDMAGMSRDPYAFVLYSFEWGEGELVGRTGPYEWQAKILKEVRDGLKTVDEAIREAVASGHGIGKSALVAWLILWAMSTCEDTRGVVTANTATQLSTKTWSEMATWYRRCITRHWFTLTATAIFSADPKHEKTWRVDCIPWSESNTEAFAGLHNKGKRIIVIFDEASAIADSIWDVTEGALTDEGTEIIWCAFGNPTRNTGKFHACFNSAAHRWSHVQIDSRTVPGTNKKQIDEWVQDYGEDSDFVRVRVKGEFPRVSEGQFIPADVIAAARGRHLRPAEYNFAAKILTLDNAWTGGDEIVIGLRQGLAYRQLATFKKNDDDFIMAGHLARFDDEEGADAVFIDLGWGTGVYSAGKQMGRKHWMLVANGGESSDPGYVNKRAETWGLMRKWLKEGGAFPDDPGLAEELSWPMAWEVAVGKNAGKIILESKEAMKKRSLRSPNRADALALSFAFPVKKKLAAAVPRSVRKDYDPLAA